MKRLLTILALAVFPILLFGQANGKLVGKVLDEDGNPLIGANVIVEGTYFGAATDVNANFEISIKPGTYNLRAQFVGYKSEIVKKLVVKAGQSTEVNFQLQPDAFMAGDVVVVGYGVQQKREVTGAVTSVKMKSVQKVATTQTAEALQGAVAGIDVSAQSGAPGSAPSIKIRGIGSIQDNNPLVIVDGVPGSLSLVDPADIESMDILKDASTAAIYGSRAANGVIIINTKRGTAGDLKVNYQSQFTSQVLPDTYPLMTNTDEWVRVAKMAYDNAGKEYPDYIKNYTNGSGPNSDWQDEYFKNAGQTKHSISVSGGSENLNFAVSASHARQDGIVIGTDYERSTLRINSDFKKGKLKIGESFSVARTKDNSRNKYNFAFFHLSRLAPIVPVYDKNNPSGYGSQNDFGGLAEADNIILQQDLFQNKTDNVNLLMSGYLEYDILPELKYTFRVSQNIWDGSERYLKPKYKSGEIDKRDLTWLRENRSRSYKTVIESFANYNKTFGKHSVGLMAGAAQEDYTSKSLYGTVEGFLSDNVTVPGAGEQNDDVSGWRYDRKLRSLFARVNYSYDDKYLITANVRRDGSSKFNEDDRWGTFPSVSAAWRISKESFFNIPEVTDFKIRGGYGVLGMSEINDYAYMPVITSDDAALTNYPFGEGRDQTILVGSRFTAFPSYNIKWEESKETNFGFDVGMFDERLSFSFDYFKRESDGVLLRVPLPPSAGSSGSPYSNAASVENTGFEISTSYRNYDSEFKYQVSVNVSSYTNEVTSLGSDLNDALYGGEVHWSMDKTTKTVVGKPIGTFYLYKTDGIFRSQDEINNYKNKDGKVIQPGAQPGDVRYVDTNGDGKITTDDKQLMGNAIPDATVGFNFSATYKDFDFNLNVYAVFGKDMINGSRWLSMDLGKMHGMHKDLSNSWTPENPNTDIPRLVYGDNRNTTASDLWLEDASYIRLKHVELGYTVPKSVLNSFGIGSLRIYVAADNLFTITDYTGYDPSIDYGSLLSRGVDRSPYPTARKYSTGIQLGL